MLRILLDARIDFLVRVPADHSFDAVTTFRESGGHDYRVVLAPAGDAQRGADASELRAVKLTSPNGGESFYPTSLRRAHFSRAQIAEFYHLRWQAEELFALEKSAYFGQRQFHARSALGVRQEISAQAICVVLARFLLAAAADHVDAPYHDLSVKSAVLALADYLTRLGLDDPDRARLVLPRLLDGVARTRDKRRPGRSCPRRSFKLARTWPWVTQHSSDSGDYAQHDLELGRYEFVCYSETLCGRVTASVPQGTKPLLITMRLAAVETLGVHLVDKDGDAAAGVVAHLMGWRFSCNEFERCVYHRCGWSLNRALAELLG